ncbi:hypothetical protein [Spirillospora sp. NPDC048819]|uniref:hypothetical protein n=1 Tax=Spirillospora sp. NPDC048819 TaxID=3155268 RepID=UPI0033F8EA34
MNSKRDRYLIIGAVIAVLLIAFVGCAAIRNDEPPGGEGTTENSSPPADPVTYTVASVEGKRVKSSNCVIARVRVTNNRSSSIEGKYTNFPSPFTLLNANGEKIRSIKEYLRLKESISPGQTGSGSITFCAAGITRGSKVTLYHDGKKWKATVPKPKPKPKPRPTVEAPRLPPKSGAGGGGGGNGGGGGAYPGYTEPRCYEPGGKVWHPC